MASRKTSPKRPRRGDPQVWPGRGWLGLAIALVVVGAPVPAAAILGDTRDAFGLDGSLRTIGAVVDNYEIGGLGFVGEEADGSSQTLLRLVIAGYPAEWLSYEAHGVQEITLRTVTTGITSFAAFGGGGSGGGAVGTTGALRYRVVDGDWHWHEGTSVDARFFCDRLNFKLALPFADITVGRQAVTFGKAYFWNPLDVFFAFDPTAFDRDYKGGVDALRVDVPLGDFSGVTVIGALGDPRDGRAGYRAAAIARAYATLFEWDVAVQGGKLHGGAHVGAGASGVVGPVEVRLEGSYFWPLDDPPPPGDLSPPEALTFVAGVGRLFENSLSLQAEYLYNGAGQLPLAEIFPLLARGSVLHASEHVLGGVASYELSPLIRGSLAALVSLSDGSGLIQPGLVYSAADEVDIVAGALVAFGKRPHLDVGSGAVAFLSEFGSYPNVFYAEIKAYF